MNKSIKLNNFIAYIKTNIADDLCYNNSRRFIPKIFGTSYLIPGNILGVESLLGNMSV